MQHHVKHAVEKQIVPPVQQQQINVQNVPQIIIQTEQDVRYVQVNTVLHVMQKQECAHHVNVDIIWVVELVHHVPVKWLNVPPVQLMDHLVVNAMKIIS